MILKWDFDLGIQTNRTKHPFRYSWSSSSPYMPNFCPATRHPFPFFQVLNPGLTSTRSLYKARTQTGVLPSSYCGHVKKKGKRTTESRNILSWKGPRDHRLQLQALLRTRQGSQHVPWARCPNAPWAPPGSVPWPLPGEPAGGTKGPRGF